MFTAGFGRGALGLAITPASREPEARSGRRVRGSAREKRSFFPVEEYRLVVQPRRATRSTANRRGKFRKARPLRKSHKVYTDESGRAFLKSRPRFVPAARDVIGPSRGQCARPSAARRPAFAVIA